MSLFNAGKNIAIKVPVHEFNNVVSFYQDVLGFKKKINQDSDEPETVCFEFGRNNLWIDRKPGISQAEIWLEITSDDMEAAKKHLQEHNVVSCNYIENLPSSLDGCWICSPGNIVHLVNQHVAVD